MDADARCEMVHGTQVYRARAVDSGVLKQRSQSDFRSTRSGFRALVRNGSGALEVVRGVD